MIHTIHTAVSCTGSGGDWDGPCVFPFSYENDNEQLTQFNGCTTEDADGTLWCATAVDSNGMVDSYGYCDSNCQIDDGTITTTTTTTATTTLSCTGSGGDWDGPCILPFSYITSNDQLTQFNGCTTEDALLSTLWCATAVDSNGMVDSYGYCDSNCPIDNGTITTTTTTTATTSTTTTTTYSSTTTTTTTGKSKGQRLAKIAKMSKT